ncbi:hypothetical protein L6164_004867 [Bauhinia variegata]|uniref:Uncharacterized protein n=1 Tax=Bauhinia variegata TaxID=167791 RepID=A0ACB9PQX5_BAUVA|nr:hypothetical protein L6164_004867 [Bauhinia variegata]
MELNSLELKVCYCKDLKAFNFFQKLTLYALVSIVRDDPKRKLNEKQQQRTQTDRDADGDGNNPEWYHEMRFDLGWVSFHDCDHLFLHFEFRHDGLLLGDKLIGETRVPLKDLIQDCAGIVRFVNYEVRNGDGKPNGVVNFSYKVNGNGVAANQSGDFLEGKITGYPVVPAAQETELVQYPNATNYDYSPNQSQIQYPRLEIDSSPCGIVYPPLAIPVNATEEGYPSPSSFAPPPVVSSPSSAGYNYYYPPAFSPRNLTAAPPFGSPPPPPYWFPPPPPPHMMSGAGYHPPPCPNFPEAPRW